MLRLLARCGGNYNFYFNLDDLVKVPTDENLDHIEENNENNDSVEK